MTVFLGCGGCFVSAGSMSLQCLSPLLQETQSLYKQSRSLVHIESSKLDLFPIRVGLCQGCPWSTIMFIFIDTTSKHSQVMGV